MMKRLKTNTNNGAGYRSISGDLLSKNKSCFMSLDAPDNMGCFNCKFAPESHGFRMVTLPLGHGCPCHGGLVLRDWFIGSQDGVVVICHLQNGPPAAREMGASLALADVQ